MGTLKVESVDSQINKNEDLSSEEGFICNSSEHWISIRKVDGKWYNLNSTNRDGPQIIGEFYLSAFLHSVKEGGYTIFVVRGTFPASRKDDWPNLRANQHFIEAEAIEKFHEKNKTKLNMGAGDENDIEEAIKRSLQDQDEGHHMGMEEEKQSEKERPVFTGQGIGLGSSSQCPKTYPKSQHDPELAFALKLSLEQKANEKISGQPMKLNLTYPSSQKKIEVSLQWTVEDLYDLVKYHMEGDYDFYLAYSYPRKRLEDLSQLIGSLELTNNERIHVIEA